MRLLILFLVTFGITAAAQDKMADTLRKGVVEEESRHNLAAAIQNYQTVLTQYSDARETAATALFRVAECYRKEGKNAEAIAAYQRVLREFGEQAKLVSQSKAVLTGTFHASTETAPNRSQEETDQNAVRQAALGRYRQTIQEEMAVVRDQLDTAERNHRSGLTSQIEVDQFKEKLIQLERELAAFDAGLTSPRK